jgi:hypothetical protein
VVEHKDKILEKPEDADHARDMLHGWVVAVPGVPGWRGC